MAAPKTAPAWRRAFLRELARSGSVKLAAQACGIDRSTAYQARRANAAFAASWARALAAARDRLSPSRVRGAEGVPEEQRSGEGLSEPARALSPALAWPESRASGHPLPQAGGERKRLAPKLRPDEIVRSSKSGRCCIVRPGPGRWSARAERAFLDELTASANVAAAARAAGVSTTAAYNRRKLWPAFAALWAEALAEGYVRIETLLIHAATATLDPEPAGDVGPELFGPPAMSVDQALNLFKLHRASQHGGRAQRYGWRRQEPDIEEVRAEVLRRLEAIERGRALALREEKRDPGSSPGGIVIATKK